MDDMEVQPAADAAPGLSQWQRVVNTFTAPSKTFEDIKRGNRSWWLPLILGAIASYMLFGAVVQKIGMEQAIENQIHLNPKAEERLADLTPEQRAMNTRISVRVTEGMFLANPLLAMAGFAVLSLGLLGTINFGFGGKAKYSSIFAVWFYAWLPGVIKTLLGIIVIYAGIAPESFNLKNFAPTNLGAFLDPVSTNHMLYALATSMDAITIWAMVLLGMGTAIVAGVKRSAGYIAVFGWWVIFVVVGVGLAALS